MSLHKTRRTGEPYDAEEVRFVTEALLSLYREQGGPDLTENGMARQPRRDAVQLQKLAKWIGGPDDPFLEAEIDRAIASSNLPPRQLSVFELRMKGWTFDQIGRRLGASTASVARSFVRAVARIRQAHERDAFAGLGEIYRFETRRRQ